MRRNQGWRVSGGTIANVSDHGDQRFVESLKSEVDGALNTINSGLSADAFATSLPIIGTTLSSALGGANAALLEAQNLATQINNVIGSLETDLDNIALTESAISNKINAALGSVGINGSVSTTIDDNNITLTFNTEHQEARRSISAVVSGWVGCLCSPAALPRLRWITASDSPPASAIRLRRLRMVQMGMSSPWRRPLPPPI